MKHVSCLYVSLLAICMFGCQVHQTEPEMAKKERSYTKSNEYRVSVNELSEIIPPLCDDLGIEIEQNAKRPNRIDIVGTSLSGRQVVIEAEEIVKGTSFIQVTAKADGHIAVGLCDTVYQRIRDAIDHYKKRQLLP